MRLEKYCGSGNDFLIFLASWKADSAFCSVPNDELARLLCSRNYGIGADGLVMVTPLKSAMDSNADSKLESMLDSCGASYRWDFYNCDGSEAAMCGNAARCVGAFALAQKIAPKKHRFQAKERVIEVENHDNNIVEVSLGAARDFSKLNENLFFVNTGVPHVVEFVDSPAALVSPNLDALSKLRHKHNANVNVAFVEFAPESCADSNADSAPVIKIATFERGVENITLACGTGMAAAFFVALHTGRIAGCKNNTDPKNTTPKATLIPPSGERLRLSAKGQSIQFAGKIAHIATIFAHKTI